MKSRQLFDILSPRARLTFLAAIFFIFAPISLIAVSNIARNWYWVDVVGWMVGSALIAVSWAYAASKRRHWWLPIVTNVMSPMAQSMIFSGSGASGNFGVSAGSVITVVSISLGYVMFIMFIRGEGTRTVHLQTEMELAKEIHDHLVPDVAYQDERWEILGSSNASTEVGGDLLDLSHRDGSLLVTVADVSGHGVRAGVMMAMIKSALKTRLLISENRDGLFGDLNNAVHQLKRPDMYATGAHLALERDRKVLYTGAGHPPLLLVRAGENRCELHESQNPPLGVVASLPFASATLSVQPGDLLLVLTDGLLEAQNKQGELFGMERVQALIAGAASRPLAEIRTLLLESVRAHGLQDDDQTVVLIRAK